MKKKLLTLLAIFAVSPLLLQCASQNDIKNLNYQLRIVNKKIDDMKAGTVGQMQQRQAASASQIDELRREVLKLSGQLEEMAHNNRQLKEKNKEMETTIAQKSASLQNEIKQERATMAERERDKNLKIAQLEEKLSRNQESLRSIQQSRMKEAELKAKEAARAAEEARIRATASSKTLAANSSSGILNIAAEKKKRIFSASQLATQSQTPQTQKTQPQKTVSASPPSGNLLQSADAEYANGNYKKAYKLYEQFAANNPNRDKAITARFMMGECLFYQKEYDQAILQYQKIISNSPRHPRAASALLKQGMAFESLSDFETAKIIYKKINSSYPKSPEAATAKERSGKLN